MSQVIAANASRVMIDGEAVPGIQAIDFKITRNRQNVHAIGTDERIGSDYGGLFVQGAVRVKSIYPKLDDLLYQPIPSVTSFQIVVELQPQGIGEAVRKITFDECVLEDKVFGMDASGVGITTYNFTSTRIREE